MAHYDPEPERGRVGSLRIELMLGFKMRLGFMVRYVGRCAQWWFEAAGKMARQHWSWCLQYRRVGGALRVAGSARLQSVYMHKLPLTGYTAVRCEWATDEHYADSTIWSVYLRFQHCSVASIRTLQTQQHGQIFLYYNYSVAEWLACWTQAQKGLGSNRSRYDVW